MENQVINISKGGTGSYKAGDLKRRLDPVPVFLLDSFVEGNPEATPVAARVRLKGLHKCLELRIGVGIPGREAGDFPTNPGTVQLTPAGKMPQTDQRIPVRPVFQNPAGAINENDPLPQNIPFGWEGTTNEDEVWIDVTLNGAEWATEGVDGRVMVYVTVEFNGNWWDIAAIDRALSNVTLEPMGDVVTVGTAVEAPE